MRTNLPVTQQGFKIGTEQTLVSVTDIKGRITYCNQAFTEVSNSMRLFRLKSGELTVSQTDAVGLRRGHKQKETAASDWKNHQP